MVDNVFSFCNLVPWKKGLLPPWTSSGHNSWTNLVWFSLLLQQTTREQGLPSEAGSLQVWRNLSRSRRPGDILNVEWFHCSKSGFSTLNVLYLPSLLQGATFQSFLFFHPGCHIPEHRLFPEDRDRQSSNHLTTPEEYVALSETHRNETRVRFPEIWILP